jgi:hypothetical protein
MGQRRRSTYSIAAAGIALTFLSSCQYALTFFSLSQNQLVHADQQQFEAPSTATMKKDEDSYEGYFDDYESFDDSAAPAHNREEHQRIPDQKIDDDQRSPDPPEGSDTPDIAEPVNPTEESGTASPEPEMIHDDPVHDIEPEVESEEPRATEGMESREFDEPPTEDSVVSDDAAVPSPTNEESEVPLSEEVVEEEPHTADEDSVESDDVNGEAESPSTADEGHPDEQVNEDEPVNEDEQVNEDEHVNEDERVNEDEPVNEDTVPSENEESEEPREYQPQARNEEPDDDPSLIDFDDIDSADSLPEESPSPPEDTVPPSVDAHTAEQTGSEEVVYSAEDLDDRIEEESTPEETVDAVDADEQDEELETKSDDLNSNESEENDESLPKENTEKASADPEKPSQPKTGSLASFFEKVSAEPEKAPDTMTKPTKMQGPGANKKDDIPEGEVPVPYCGVWGVFRWERPRHADLSTLFLLFQDYFMSDPDDTGERKGTKMDISDMASIMTEEIIRQGQQKLEETLATPDVSETIDAAKPKSVNHEFVEGLDDIDKFFEGVDPPDELDVGAAGTSIQDVLMGQGTRILLKRISIGAQKVKKTTISLKNKAVERYQNKDFKINLPEKEEALRIAKQTSKQAGQWIWTTSQQVFHTAQAILDDMFEGEDLDEIEFDVPPLPTNPDQAGSDEMDEFMRQWRSSEKTR